MLSLIITMKKVAVNHVIRHFRVSKSQHLPVSMPYECCKGGQQTRGADSRQQTIDSRQQTAGSRQERADSRQQTADPYQCRVPYECCKGGQQTRRVAPHHPQLLFVACILNYIKIQISTQD
jgi:hypothetical protein